MDNKIYIDFSIGDRAIFTRGVASIPSKSLNHVFARFRFSRSWDGLSSVAIMSTTTLDAQYISIIDGQCAIPNEMMDEPGSIYVSVYAGSRRTVNTAIVTVFKSGFILEGEPPKPPTPPSVFVKSPDGSVLFLQYEEDGFYFYTRDGGRHPLAGGSGGSSSLAWLPYWVAAGTLGFTRSESDIPPTPTNLMGPAGQILSASASDLAEGMLPTVTLGGTPEQRTLQFGIPAGRAGSDGQQGDAGEITSATAFSLPAGTNPTITLGGTPQQRAIAFGIPSGAKGDPGNDGASIQGPAGQITNASAIGLPSTAQPTVTLGGTPEQRTIEFGIPAGGKGDKGDDGNSIQGPAGQIISATASSLAAGATPTVTLGGTPEIRTLAFGIPVGAKGTDGTDGIDGVAGQIASATAVQLPAGSQPTITLGGTAVIRIMEFGIPKGDKGEDATAVEGAMSSVIYDPQDKETDIFQYVDDAVAGSTGGGDMLISVYDTENRETDIFLYVDGLVGEIGAMLDIINRTVVP